MKKIVVVGAGSLARIVHAFMSETGELEIVAAAVESTHLADASLGGLPVLPFEDLELTYPPDEHGLLVAVGYRQVNRRRAALFEQAKTKGYGLVTYVHPTAFVAGEASLGENCIVFPRAVVEPFADIGHDVVLWSGAVVAHDTTVGAHCFLGPNATVSGNVTLGARTFVGANATIRDGITVGADTVVGAGALIKRDTTAGEVFAPAPTEASARTSSDYDTL